MQLEFKVDQQIITRIDSNAVVEKSKNYLDAKFTFSKDWQGVTKTAIFKKADIYSKGRGTAYEVILEADMCKVPYEVIESPMFLVSVFGGDRITANRAEILVLQSGYEEGETPKEPTPDVYAQILKKIEEMETGSVSDEQVKKAVDAYFAENPTVTEAELVEAVENALKEAKDSGEFNGEDGYSPVARVEQTTEGAKITIEDAEGTTTATVKDGKNGTSVTHSWDGTVLTINSASGSSSVDLKGDKGDTPEKGKDYFTDEDKAELVNDVLKAIPNGDEVEYPYE